MEQQTQVIIGHSEIHAIIRNAQVAMWDTEVDGATMPYMIADIDPQEVYERFVSLLPASDPISEHYRTCQSCKRAILQCGNWVAVNYDGSLDPIMFPDVEIDPEFHNEWTDLLFGMRQLIAMSDDNQDVRQVRGVLRRPTDGGQFPVYMRKMDETELHFDVFITPVAPVSARTLCKLNDQAFQQISQLITNPGVNGVNLAGLINEADESETLWGKKTDLAVRAAALVYESVDEHCHTASAKYNLMLASCLYSEGLKDFPIELMRAMSEFEETGDADHMFEIIRGLNLQ